MRLDLPFISAASNAILKPGGLLKWKKRLVKDARLSLPLTKAMKIARLTSPLLDAPRQSSPRPRLRHGRRLALLFQLNQTLNLFSLFFVLLLALLPRLPPLLIFLTVLLPGNRLWSTPPYLRSHFSVSQPKTLRSRARGNFRSSAEPRFRRSLIRPSALLSPLLNFLRLPPTFLPPLPLAQMKLPIPC